MWFGSGRRLLTVSVVVVLVIWVLQMWVCCHSCQAGAIRIFPESAVANVEFTHTTMDNKTTKKEDLFNKYYTGSRTFGPSPSNRTQKGFRETKRRVPSCPDPLHN